MEVEGAVLPLYRKGVHSRVLGKGKGQESVAVEVWAERKEIMVINY